MHQVSPSHTTINNFEKQLTKESCHDVTNIDNAQACGTRLQREASSGSEVGQGITYEIA